MKAIFAKWRWVPVFVTALFLSGTAIAQVSDGLMENVIPLDKDSPALKEVRDSLTEELAKVKPQTKGKTQTAETEAGGQVIYENSGHRAIWGEWSFCQWSDGKLVEKANWHSESPYNNIDPPFSMATVMTKGGTKENFRITDAGSDRENTQNYTVLKDGQPYATVKIEWKADHQIDEIWDLAENAWFFQKLARLAHDDFPETRSDTNNSGDSKEAKYEILKPSKLPQSVSIHVTGTVEAKKRFANGK